ncbi:TetR family transcriptional regulator [Candidatus Poriferisodalis sp.]|uniref:TetR family transcriptional regulator n=1 Tax=Candidatus Poriferisodalis sp. TaxID=3101277 RepID=UPI003B5C43F1
MGRPSEPLLSQQMIVDAAMAIIDESGMQAMTTRAIASRLGVGQASLYNHISNRDELLELLNARVLAGVDLHPLDHPDWKEAVYGGTLAFLKALQAHPNMMGVLATRPARTDPSLTYYERMHERLRDAGLSAQDSARFLFAIDDYCIGAALNTEVDVEINNRQDKFPLVTEAMEAGRPADHHQATLRLLLNGLMATVDMTKHSNSEFSA